MIRVSPVVLDTSTLVSAALRPASTPAQAFQKALATSRVCASEVTLNELYKVLIRPKFDGYLAQTYRLQFFELFKMYAEMVLVTQVVDSCRDPKRQLFSGARVKEPLI